MVAREMLADVVPPVKTSDTVQKVLDRMAEFRVSHLPVVNEVQFLGLISDEDLIEVADYNSPVGSLDLPLTTVDRYVDENRHVYDIVRMMNEKSLSVLPVLDARLNYLGLISVNTIIEFIAQTLSVKEPGGIIVLEVSSRENSLSHIAQIVESNNSQILSSYIRSFEDSTRLEVTLKLNHRDISPIVAAFTRYNYVVKETFNDIKNDNDNGDRYDQLMNYLSF